MYFHEILLIKILMTSFFVEQGVVEYIRLILNISRFLGRHFI